MRKKYASLLISFCHDGPLLKTNYGVQHLELLLNLRKKSYIDDNGMVTEQGFVKSLMDEFDIRIFDILALAYIASKPVHAARDDFLNVSLEYHRNDTDVKRVFNKLVKRKLISRQGPAVYAIHESKKAYLEPYMKFLLNINQNRDEWFTAKTAAC